MCTIVCRSGDSAPASLALHRRKTPSSLPRARSITPLVPLPASCSGNSAPASCDPASPPPPPHRPPASKVSYIWIIRCTPFSSQILGESMSYSPKNMVIPVWGSFLSYNI